MATSSHKCTKLWRCKWAGLYHKATLCRLRVISTSGTLDLFVTLRSSHFAFPFVWSIVATPLAIAGVHCARTKLTMAGRRSLQRASAYARILFDTRSKTTELKQTVYAVWHWESNIDTTTSLSDRNLDVTATSYLISLFDLWGIACKHEFLLTKSSRDGFSVAKESLLIYLSRLVLQSCSRWH